MQVELRPAQGSRFQPTGFPDLGAAEYQAPLTGDNGRSISRRMLLVESAQSVANRLETVCWDEAAGDLTTPLAGMPYVVVTSNGQQITSSLQEAHRLNSPYILEADGGRFKEQLKTDLEVKDAQPIDIGRLARLALRYDPNSVLHGVFLAQPDIAGGRYRLARLLSGFIEAADIEQAGSGGVKNDRVDPSGEAKAGFGNVPFHRTEYTARTITAYFNLDVARLRSYRLGHGTGGHGEGLTPAKEFLVTLAFWKVRRFLETGLRLRTACDFEADEGGLRVTRGGIVIPPTESLEARMKELIKECGAAGLFAAPPVTRVEYAAGAGARKRRLKDRAGTTMPAMTQEGDE